MIPDFLAIVGPTASGKSELAVAVARRLGGEIVSMDSRQIYRGMDIGTAKTPEDERGGVPHHGIDLVDPDGSYSAGQFARDARRWIEEIRARGRVPVLAGGTGFFLRALTEPIFEEPRLDVSRRTALRGWLAAQPREELARWTGVLDPDRAAVAAGGGTQRLARTLEVALLSGRPLTWWHRNSPSRVDALAGVVVRVDVPRAELDLRIEARLQRMFASGLIEEVRRLLAGGFTASDPGMTGVGYREVVALLAGEIDREEAVERIRRATRAYAKRQETWFRNQSPDSIVVDGMEPLGQRVERVVRAWAASGGSPSKGAES